VDTQRWIGKGQAPSGASEQRTVSGTPSSTVIGPDEEEADDHLNVCGDDLGRPIPISESPYYVWDMNRREFVRVTGMGLLLSAFPALPISLSESPPPTESHGSPMTVDALDSYWQILDQCWTLCNGGQLVVVHGLIQTYLPHVLRHAPDRPAAAALAAQSLRLLSVVRTHELRLHEKVALNQQAVEYARQAGDTTVLASALTELAVAFKYADQPHNSFAVYDEALNHAERAAPLVRSRVYAATAAACAQRSLWKEAAKYMGLAHQAFPASPQREPNWLSADFGVWLLAFYEGLSHMFGHDLVNARRAFSSYEQHPTASLTPERNRLEILNQQARVAILDDDRDAFATYLESSVVRSITIRSRKRLDEAVSLYRHEIPANWREHLRGRQFIDLIEQQASA
jgi:hypothetical protein